MTEQRSNSPESNEPIFHGIDAVENGRGQVLFAAARFIRTLEETYARPSGRPAEGAPTWPYHTFGPEFRFAAEKFWETVWKIDRVAALIQGARYQIKDLQPPSAAPEALSSHLMALKDIPIYLDSLVVYLRIVGDCIANLTPYLYGQTGKNITKRSSFRQQRIWFMSTHPRFDSQYVAILKSCTKWFDVLAGDPPRFVGLRDAIIHYRGGMQIMYRPTDDSKPAQIMPMLFSDYKTLTLDLFTLLQKVMKDMCVFLDRFVVHFNALATKRIGSMILNLDNPDAIRLYRYDADLPSAWLYPDVNRTRT